MYTVPPSKYAEARRPPLMAPPSWLKVPKALSVASMAPRVTVPLEDWKKTYSSFASSAVTEMAVPLPMEMPSPVGPAVKDGQHGKRMVGGLGGMTTDNSNRHWSRSSTKTAAAREKWCCGSRHS